MYATDVKKYTFGWPSNKDFLAFNFLKLPGYLEISFTNCEKGRIK